MYFQVYSCPSENMKRQIIGSDNKEIMRLLIAVCSPCEKEISKLRIQSPGNLRCFGDTRGCISSPAFSCPHSTTKVYTGALCYWLVAFDDQWWHWPCTENCQAEWLFSRAIRTQLFLFSWKPMIAFGIRWHSFFSAENPSPQRWQRTASSSRQSSPNWTTNCYTTSMVSASFDQDVLPETNAC